LTVAAAASLACLIEWHDTKRHGVVRYTVAPHHNVTLNAVLGAISRRHHRPADAFAPVHLAPSEIAHLIPRRHPDNQAIAAVAMAVADGPLHATIITLFPYGRPTAELESVERLAAHNVIATLVHGEAAASREFWRRRAIETAERAGRAQAALSASNSERKSIDSAIAAAAKLRPRGRFGGLGTIIARSGPFDVWLVALAEDGQLRVAAASAKLAPIPALDDDSALADCFKRQIWILRKGSGQAGAQHEDRLFAHYFCYLCVPFEQGAIALAAREEIDAATAARTAALAARMNPIIANWMLEAETERLRALVRNLGLRMFGAIDAERARIARDLHDHQAQLLAAARIGIEAGPDEARGIFKQLEDALRLRVRELRPATLGRSTLEDALRYELHRLTDAGVKGRLLHADRMNLLTRPVQQVCYQVAREALSNVIRHAGATRVEISAERQGGWARLSIRDNGRGIAGANGAGGMGLRGLCERLEMLGGKLRIDSRPGSTRLIAEIPEPA
ncbi:MAG: sensor histidine kinase, partial [Candidatus Binataceae bacterium]